MTEEEVRKQLIEARAEVILKKDWPPEDNWIKFKAQFPEYTGSIVKSATKDVDWFLSQPNVALIDKDAKLPDIADSILNSNETYKVYNPNGTSLSTDPDDIGDYSWQKPNKDRLIIDMQVVKTQQVMLKAGWVKKLEAL